jgi:hypothetical protein
VIWSRADDPSPPTVYRPRPCSWGAGLPRAGAGVSLTGAGLTVRRTGGGGGGGAAPTPCSEADGLLAAGWGVATV